MYPCISFHLSFHSAYFYSASSSPLLLRGSSDTARILCRSFTPKLQTTASEGFVQGPYLAARAEFETATFQAKGAESTNEPPRPTTYIRVCMNVCMCVRMHVL